MREMKSFLSLSTSSSATVFHFRPLMAKLQCRTFQNYPASHLPIGTTCRNYMQCSQIKLKKDRLSFIISINHSQSLTNGGSMSMSSAINSHLSPGSLLNYWSFNNGNTLTSLESGVFAKRLFSTASRGSNNKNQNVGGFSKHWKKPKASGAAHDKDETNTTSRISASKDVDAVTSTETAVGDAKLGSAVSRTRNKKSKVNETEKKESKSKKNKGQASFTAVSEKAAGAKSMTTTSQLKKSLPSKSGQVAARASQKKATEEMPNEVRNGSTKQQSNKKNGNSSIKRTTKKAVNGSAEKQKPQKIGKLQPFAQGKLKSLYPSAGKCVVVVESVTKAKVIQGYLGDMYEVLPSYGHVRDLAARSGSVRPDDDFSIVWEVPSAAWTHLNSIKVALSGAKILILASDPDREGEAIAWHIVEMLQQQDALRQDLTVARVVFHEITETSIKNALQAPRGIDVNLVHAYLARRALDYLIGFNISPLLWRKLPGCQSAGRVQSAALSLLCDREMEIDEFNSQEYWTIGAKLKKQEQDSLVNAHLTHFDSKKLNQFSISSDTEAKDMEQKINSADFQVVGSKKTKTHRNPPTPHITSTLQQDAANKLDFATSYTMKVAQKLYEGVQLSDGKATGLITYLRTDGLHISDEAVGNIRSLIIERYGQDFASKGPRKYFRKVKNAQEAHEAIRPTNIHLLPSMLVGVLDEDSLKLYTLIWSRTVACQMEPVTIEQVQVDIGNAGKSIVFRSSCSRVEFPGYQAVYEDVEAGAVRYKESDALNRQEAFGILDSLKTGDSLYLGEADMKQHFTEPPPRYSEGSLVKKLEELGIGRPSTYASTLKVLKDRNYVTVKNRVLHPEFRGRMVSAFLSHHFTEVTDYSFTADMETELDNVSAGLTDWKGLLKDYWTRFQLYCSRTESVHIHQVEKMLERTYDRFLFGSLPDKSRTCPSCMEGTLIFKVSRFGAGYFIGCDQHPNCKYIAKTLYGDDEKEETPQSSSVDEVTVGFWMHLPMRFCKMHLPKNDTTVFLENESGEEYILNYIAERTALSGGWKAFCAANNLHEGDVLVFHLVKPSRFKVYIVKGNSSSQGDGEFGIPSSGAYGKEIISEPAEKDVKSSKKAEPLKLLPVGHQEENNQENGLIAVENNKGYVADQSENESEDRASETLRVIKLSGPTVDFNNVKGIENFRILLNGFAIDSELSEHHRTKYYELCRSQSSFLHSNLLNSINHKLAVEIIIGTVDISEGIRSSKLSSSQADYGVWDKTLKGFELLGMKVGFLRERLSRLMSLALESEEAMESECREVRLEQARVDEEMKSLELRLLKLKETRERLDDEMEILKENAEKHELTFQEAVNAPW